MCEPLIASEPRAGDASGTPALQLWAQGACTAGTAVRVAACHRKQHAAHVRPPERLYDQDEAQGRLTHQRHPTALAELRKSAPRLSIVEPLPLSKLSNPN